MKVWIFIFPIIFGSSVAISSDYPPLPVPAKGCDDFCHSNLTQVLAPLEGIWYISHSIPNLFTTDIKCMVFNYTKINATASNYVITATRLSDNTKRVTEGTINFDGSIKLSLTKLGLRFEPQSIIRTQNFIVSYICIECGFFTKEGSGIFPLVISKLTKPGCDNLDEIKDALKHCNIPFEALLEIDQENCFETC